MAWRLRWDDTRSPLRPLLLLLLRIVVLQLAFPSSPVGVNCPEVYRLCNHPDGSMAIGVFSSRRGQSVMAVICDGAAELDSIKGARIWGCDHGCGAGRGDDRWR